MFKIFPVRWLHETDAICATQISRFFIWMDFITLESRGKITSAHPLVHGRRLMMLEEM